MRRVIFWASQVLILPIFAVGMMLAMLGNVIEDICHKYEDWALGYSKNGWIHRGAGIYTYKDKE